MKILYIHPSSVCGGASKSIAEISFELNSDLGQREIVYPAGSVQAQFVSAGFVVRPIGYIPQFDNTAYGYYRGFRWLIILREFLCLPTTYYRIRKIILSNNYYLIHLNEVTLIPWARFFRFWSQVPIVVHVRSLQRQSANDRRTRWLHQMLEKDADHVIAIDETVRRTLPATLPVTIVHNSMKVDVTKIQVSGTRTRFRVAIVGVLLKLKGVYEFLEAARIIVQEMGYDIEFYIVGENARQLSGWKVAILKRLDLAHDVRGDIEDFIAKHSLQNHVVLTGFVEDVQSIYADLDVLCFPSHLNAAGRPVFEAAFFGVPSIVAVKDPPPDTIVDGETGICIDEPDARLLATAIEQLFNNREDLKRLGENARALAHRNFDIEKNAEALLQVYKDAVSQRKGGDDASNRLKNS